LANITLVPTKEFTFSDKWGNTYIVMEVNFVTGADTFIVVPDSAVSVAELPATHAVQTLNAIAGSATSTISPTANQIGVQNLTTGTSGLGFSFAAGDGVKQVHIDTGSTTGTYTLVVRCIGSAAGTGSTKEAGL